MLPPTMLYISLQKVNQLTITSHKVASISWLGQYIKTSQYQLTPNANPASAVSLYWITLVIFSNISLVILSDRALLPLAWTKFQGYRTRKNRVDKECGLAFIKHIKSEDLVGNCQGIIEDQTSRINWLFYYFIQFSKKTCVPISLYHTPERPLRSRHGS